jgi:predicted MFS family arabinose efflux permease
VLVAMIPLLYAAGLLTLDLLYAFVFVLSVVGTAAGPALSTAVPLVVAPADLVAANALIQGTSTVGVLLGPAFAGLGISLFGIARVFYVDAGSFGLFAIFVALMRIPERGPMARVPLHLRELGEDLREGLSFLVRRQPGLLMLTAVAGAQNIGASAFVLALPVFAKEDIAAGSVWMGLLWSSYGLGMLLASLSIAMIGRSRVARMMHIALLTLALGGASVAALSFVRVKFAAATLMVVVGWSTAAFNPIVITLVQESTPVDLRARVLTAFNSANMGAVTVGMLLFGWAVDRLGNDVTMLGIGAVLLLTSGALGIVLRLQSTRRLVENLATPRSG